MRVRGIPNTLDHGALTPEMSRALAGGSKRAASKAVLPAGLVTRFDVWFLHRLCLFSVVFVFLIELEFWGTIPVAEGLYMGSQLSQQLQGSIVFSAARTPALQKCNERGIPPMGRHNDSIEHLYFMPMLRKYDSYADRHLSCESQHGSTPR